jgi:hypothetical protein
MSTVNCSVTRGYTWIFDVATKFLITRDRLNLTATPVVTVNLTGKVNSSGADIKSATVTEAMLTAAAAARIVTAVATVPAESANNIDVSIQFQDAQAASLGSRASAQIWLSTAADTWEPGALPTGGAPTILSSHGHILTAMTNSAPGLYMSNSAGLLELRFTDTGTTTKYLRLLVQSKLVVGSAALTWTT